MAISHVQTLAVVDKINEDITDCVLQLKTQFEDDPIPITDDNLTLQKFCAKLEFLLQHNQKDKFSVLGTKKSYWEYFCQCLTTSRKHTHDGIRFVKLKSELKTSTGKGRAFIRFCLSHGCLADSLQRCFGQKEITKDWYHNSGTPCDELRSQALISVLYDLNDIHFDLSPECHELDVSWPTFSRKHNESRYSWKPPSRSVSISSLVSQADSSLLNSSYLNDLGNSTRDEDPEEPESDVLNIQQRNAELERREAELLREIKDLKRLSENHVSLNGVDKVTEEFATKVELLTLQHAGRERYFAEAERVARENICSLETETLNLRRKLTESDELVSALRNTVAEKDSNLETSVERINCLERKNGELSDELKEKRSSFEESKRKVDELNECLERMRELLGQTETKLGETESREEALGHELSQLNLANEELKSEVLRQCETNELLNGELLRLRAELVSLGETVRSKDLDLKDLVDKVGGLEEQSDEKDLEIRDKSVELESLKTSVRHLEEKLKLSEDTGSNNGILIGKVSDLETLNARLHEDIKCLAQSLQTEVKKQETEKNELRHFVDNLERSKDILQKEVNEKDMALNEASTKLTTYARYGDLLAPLIDRQDSVIDEFKQSIDVIVDSSERLKTDMTKLTGILERLARSSKSEVEFLSLAYSNDSPTEDGDRELPFEELDQYPIARTASSSLGKLQILMRKKNKVEQLVSRCQDLCNDMMTFAVEKEEKLISKRMNLLQTINVVETLVKEHKKVRAAESILKYELQEKRKLLSRLRRQLESTREEWNKVRLKNVESEAEWKSLREEFASRHKQSSEESGIVEDKVVDEGVPEPAPIEPVMQDEIPIEETPEPKPDSVPSTSTASNDPTSVDTTEPRPPRRRIEILEEQCNLLYFSLLHSSKRSELLEQRLQVILGNQNSEDNSVSSDSGAGKSELPVSRQSPDGATEESELSTDAALEEEDNESGNSLGDQLETDEITEWDSQVDTTDGLKAEGPVLDELGLEVINESDDDELSEDKGLEIEDESNAQRKKALQNFVTRFKSEKDARDSHDVQMKTKITVLEMANVSLEEQVVKLQKENAQLYSKSCDFRKRAEFIFRKDRESVEQKVQAATSECSELQKSKEELTDKLESLDKELSDCRSSLELSQKKKDEVETTLSQEISSLRFQLSTEALKYERALKHYTGQEAELTEMREKLNHQEQLIMSLEETLTEIKEERKKEKEKQISEFENIEMALSTRDEECVSLNEELKKTTRSLDETKNFLIELEEQSHTVENSYRIKMQGLLTDMSEMTKDNEDLKSQVIKLTRDKDLLWKKSEHLSRSHLVPTGDRWMSDKEALECLGCKALFSFTLRKHHCRLCGRIFCHNCAGHWVLTAASSRRSRVCKECFSQHGEKELVWKEPTVDGHEEEATDVLACDNMSVDSLPLNGETETSEDNLNDSLTREETLSEASTSTAENASGLDFDVISDEEIARSLSASSPYSSPSPRNSASLIDVVCSANRSVIEIEEAGPEGLKGEVWINAGNTYNVPVVIDTPGVSLMWQFSSEPKSIAFSVAYKAGSQGPESVLLNTTRVQSHLRPVQGHLVAKHAGLYLLIFDNHFSRFMAKKVSYSLKVLTGNT